MLAITSSIVGGASAIAPDVRPGSAPPRPRIGDEPAADQADEPDDDGGQDRGPEPMDVESIGSEEPAYQEHHQAVHDEQEQPQSHHGYGQSKQGHDRPHDGVDDAQHETGDEQDLPIGDLDPVRAVQNLG